MQAMNCIPRVLCICAVVVLLLLHTPIAAAADRGAPKAENRAAFRVPLGERQLFLDDHGIASIEHLERTMHQPTKKGAVIRPDPAKGGSFQIRSAPLWDPKEELLKLLVAVSLSPCAGQNPA